MKSYKQSVLETLAWLRSLQPSDPVSNGIISCEEWLGSSEVPAFDLVESLRKHGETIH